MTWILVAVVAVLLIAVLALVVTRRDTRRDVPELRELPAGARAHYAEQWEATQRRFVDQPASALQEADDLVGDLMRRRGLGVDDRERLGRDHPGVVEHHREARAIGADEHASTEDLRRALVHYRALFDELLGDERPTRHDEIEEMHR